MASRTFRGSDGADWLVWLVHPARPEVLGSAAEWLAFQREDGTERRRLREVPPQWETLADDRLDLLRRMAQPVSQARGLNQSAQDPEAAD